MHITKWADLLTEDDWQRLVIDYARAHGWLVAHFRAAPDPRKGGRWRTPMEGDPGWPDLAMAKRGQVRHAELKSQRGVVSADQKRWLQAIYGDLWEVWVWRPADWERIQLGLGSFFLATHKAVGPPQLYP